MRINWKNLRLVCVSLLVVLGAGCSGINASKSISPATFLLPGLMQADPQPAPSVPAPAAEEPGIEVAQR